MEFESTGYRVRNLGIPTVSTSLAVVTWEDLARCPPRTELEDPAGNIHGASEMDSVAVGGINLRRVVFRGLVPATMYTFRMFWGSSCLTAATFETLSVPGGEQLARLALLADPHLSSRRTFRRGRLLGISYRLFGQVVETILRDSFDCLVILGDLADGGEQKAYVYAQECLSGLPVVKLILAGNQDNPELMEGYFPEVRGLQVVRRHGCTLVGLDTSQGTIEGEMVGKLRSVLEQGREEPVLLFTHYALVPHGGRRVRGSVAEGGAQVLRLVEDCSRVWGVFSGHKNAVGVSLVRGVAHVSCPQIVEYPCGWNVVEVYESGFIMWMRQIDDLRLVRLSQTEGDRWFGAGWSGYRLGDMAGRSFAYVV